MASYVLNKNDLTSIKDKAVEGILNVFEEKGIEEISIQDLIAFSLPQESIFWLYDNLPLPFEDKNLIENKGMFVDMSNSSFYHCNYLKDCQQIAGSTKCNNSHIVYNCFLINNSSLVYSSNDIHSTQVCSQSSTVHNSAFIIGSRDIKDSFGIINSEAIENGVFVFNSKNLENCAYIKSCENGKGLYFCQGLKDTSNRIFCNKDFAAEYGVFNRAVSKDIFNYYKEGLASFLMEKTKWNYFKLLCPTIYDYLFENITVGCDNGVIWDYNILNQIYSEIKQSKILNADVTISIILNSNKDYWTNLKNIFRDYKDNQNLIYQLTYCRYALFDN